MSYDINNLVWTDLHSEIEQRCSTDVLRIFKNDTGVCLYKLLPDDNFTDVIMIFKIIINNEMNVKIINDDYEYIDFEKLTSWTQLNELIEKYIEEPQDIQVDYNEIIEESNPQSPSIIEQIILYDETEEIIEEELDTNGDVILKNDNEWRCPNCCIVFKNFTGLQHHSKSCNDKKVVQQNCTLCDQQFSSNLQFRLHMKTHGDKTRHKCPYCHKTVVNNGSLQRHIKAIHLKQRPHKW